MTMLKILPFDPDDPYGLARGMAALDMHSPLIVEGFRYWNERRRGRPMPERGDLDPLIDIPRLAPSLMLFDVRRDPLDFRWRLVGSRIRQYMWKEYTGEWFSEDPRYNDRESAVWLALARVEAERRPVLLRPDYVGPHKDFLHVENVLMPLGVDQAGWGMQIVFMDFVSKHRGRGLHEDHGA